MASGRNFGALMKSVRSHMFQWQCSGLAYAEVVAVCTHCRNAPSFCKTAFAALGGQVSVVRSSLFTHRVAVTEMIAGVK